MTDSITKKDLEVILDKKFAQYQGTILEGVDSKFQHLEKRMDSFDQKLDRLVTTLDYLLKRITDYEDELTLVKGDIKQIKKIIKEKLGIEISAVGW